MFVFHSCRSFYHFFGKAAPLPRGVGSLKGNDFKIHVVSCDFEKNAISSDFMRLLCDRYVISV